MEQENCPICLENLTDSVWTNLSKNCCNLSVHLFCLERHQQKINQNCPHCRKPFTEAQVNNLDLHIPEPDPEIVEVPNVEEPNDAVEESISAQESEDDINLPLIENVISLAEVENLLAEDLSNNSDHSIVISDSSEGLEIPSFPSSHSLEIPSFESGNEDLLSSEIDEDI